MSPASQVILITGTSTGFGRAGAETLARHGHTVFAAMRDIARRNAPHAEGLRALAATENLNLSVVEMDVTDEASVSDAISQILDRSGRLDVAINNAGIGALGVTEAYTAAEFRRLFEVNLFGAVRVNRAVLPAMRRQKSGLLIHVSSGAGRIAIPCMAAYCASKFALEAYADTLRFELAPFGVDSVLVEPGAHRTPILENFFPPEDRARAADYGEMSGYAQKIQARFDAAGASAETPGPEVVADAFLRLVETRAGDRPFRTIPTPAMRALLEPYNDAAEAMRQITAQRYDVPELLVLRR